MHNPAVAKGGNIKLRGLLTTSRELLRKRQLKKALNNAQIAQDFAIRSGEGPDIAIEAQLVMAEIYILNAAYTSDENLKRKGWHLLEQVEANIKHPAHSYLHPELLLIRAVSLRRLNDFEAAEVIFQDLLEQLPEGDPRTARTLVHLCMCYSQMPIGLSPKLAERAAHSLLLLEKEEAEYLGANLSLAQAFDALEKRDLSRAIDEAHMARRFAEHTESPEIDALSRFFLGRVSRLRGNHQIALRLLYDAMDLAERMSCRPLAMKAHLEIGHIFATLQNDREAEKYFTIAEQEACELLDTESHYAASLALGRTALQRDDYVFANENFSFALHAASELGWLKEQGSVLGEMAGLKLKEGQLELAQHLVDEANVRFKRAEVSASTKTILTETQLMERKGVQYLPEVIHMAQAAIVQGKQHGNFELVIQALRIKAGAFAKQEMFVEAHQCEREAAELAIQLLQRSRDQHLPDLDMRAALQQKEREIEKLTQENDLKNAIVEKNDEIERANRELLQVNEELRQFAYVASHDLKEPVRQIGNYVGLIKRYADNLDERGETFFSFIIEGVDRLNRQLDSLMHYASVARVEVEVKHVNLNTVVEFAQDKLGQVVNKKDAQITIQDLPTVASSEELLRHVLLALIDNAIKFIPEGVQPQVKITADRWEGMHRIGIHDNGIGIREEYQDKVYTLFQMLHAKSDYPGTGVGLAIAQKTIQRLGGRIWFESSGENEGTSFYITLPMNIERSATLSVEGGRDYAEAA